VAAASAAAPTNTDRKVPLSTYASPQAYREAAVLTASPVQLVVMLYDGIERFLRQAEVVMGEGDIPKANERMQKGEAIIDELIATLDKSAGQVAERLEGIYVFCKRLLMEARIERAATKVEQVRKLLAPLRDAWAELAERGTSPEAALSAATQAIAR
jgi:flagellar secretion chaperone FliS